MDLSIHYECAYSLDPALTAVLYTFLSMLNSSFG